MSLVVARKLSNMHRHTTHALHWEAHVPCVYS